VRFDDLDSSEGFVVIISASEGSELVTFEYPVHVTEIDSFGFCGTGQHRTDIPYDAPAGFGVGICLSHCGCGQQETAEQPEQCRVKCHVEPGDREAG
jgi:hypothetical protein